MILAKKIFMYEHEYLVDYSEKLDSVVVIIGVIIGAVIVKFVKYVGSNSDDFLHQ